MQMQMLDIICSYLHGEHLEGRHLVAKPYAFLKIFDGVIDDLTNDDLVNAAVRIFKKTTLPTFDEKHQLLDLLNRLSVNQTVYSMPIKALRSTTTGKMTKRVNFSSPKSNRSLAWLKYFSERTKRRAIQTVKRRCANEHQFFDFHF